MKKQNSGIEHFGVESTKEKVVVATNGDETVVAKTKETHNALSDVKTLKSDKKKVHLENDNDHLFYRAHCEFSNPDTVLIVSKPNVLYFYKDGVTHGPFQEGAYKLYDDNDLQNKGFLFWKKTEVDECIVDIIVYNPSLAYQCLWGTKNPIPWRDPETNIPIEIKGRGSFDIYISDVEKFHNTLVGNDPNVTVESIVSRVRDQVMQIIRNVVINVIKDLKLGYLDLVPHEKEIAKAIEPYLQKEIEEAYGLRIQRFAFEEIYTEQAENIEAVLKEERDEAKFKKEVEEIVAEIEKMEEKERSLEKEERERDERLDDKKWEREKYLLELKRQDYDKYLEVVKVLGTHDAPVPESIKDEKKSAHYCPNCGAEVDSNASYCENCSHQLKPLERVCPHCNKKFTGKGKFCPHCGQSLVK